MLGSFAGLKVERLSKRFGTRLVVSNVSLSVKPGQVVCLLGPSGCGKTTTLRMIAGVERQDSGQILINGHIVSGGVMHRQPEERSVGLLFQDFALFPHLTVKENIAFGLIGSRSNRKARIEELLTTVNLKEFTDKYPHELSGGEQQRVALARALAPRPKIMLLDEPFSSLDDRLRDGIRDETLHYLKQAQTAVLLVTHEPQEAMRMADRIELMRDGEIIQGGEPFEIYFQPIDKQAAAFFSDLNIVHGVVNQAEVETPFGSFPSPGFADGTDVEVMVRPQHVKIDFDRSGKGPVPTPQDGVPVCGIVQRSRYVGDSSLVEFSLVCDESILKAKVPSVFLPKPGSRLWLSLRRDRCFLFPCSVQSRVASPEGTSRLVGRETRKNTL